jgi:hypothetical protein
MAIEQGLKGSGSETIWPGMNSPLPAAVPIFGGASQLQLRQPRLPPAGRDGRCISVRAHSLSTTRSCSIVQGMSDPNSSNKRTQCNHEDDGDDDERAPKRAKDEQAPSSLTRAPASATASGQAAAAMEEPLPLAESAALPAAPLATVNVSVPTEPAEASALNAMSLYAKSTSAF